MKLKLFSVTWNVINSRTISIILYMFSVYTHTANVVVVACIKTKQNETYIHLSKLLFFFFTSFNKIRRTTLKHTHFRSHNRRQHYGYVIVLRRKKKWQEPYDPTLNGFTITYFSTYYLHCLIWTFCEGCNFIFLPSTRMKDTKSIMYFQQ